MKFNNTVVILTSNLGASEMYREDSFGFGVKRTATKRELDAEYEESKEAAMRALKKVMKPELMNRLDAIEVFRALGEDEVSKIFDNLIEELRKRLAAKGLGMKVTDEAKKQLVAQGYEPKNGARPLRRMIEEQVEALIAEKMIAGEMEKGDIAVIGLKREKDKNGQRELTVKIVNE